MNPSQILTQLLALAKTDAAKTVLPLLQAFLTSVVANPTQLNLVAQVAKFEADFLAAIPGIGQDILKDLAQLVNAEAELLLK